MSEAGPSRCAIAFEVEEGRGGLGLLPKRRHRHAAFASVTAKTLASNTASSVASPPPPPPADVKPAFDVVAGATARACSQATIHPIDTLKVRLQAGDMAKQKTSMSSGMGGRVAGATVASGFQQVLSEVKTLYRGVGGAASGAGIIIGAYFAFYSTAKAAINTHADLSPGTTAFISGSVAAMGSSVVKVPLAVCIRSVQAGVYNNFFEAAATIQRQAGVRGLFTGFIPTLLEDVPDMAVKFAVYETLRPLHRQVFSGREPTVLEDLLIGGAAGATSAAVTTPLDVIKTRMMCSASQRPTVFSALADVLNTPAGPKALFRGIAPRAVSNGLNSAIFFCFFEAIRQHIVNHDATRQAQQAIDKGSSGTGQSSLACLSMSLPVVPRPQ